MNKKIALWFSFAIIVVFMVFIIFDTTTREEKAVDRSIVVTPDNEPLAMWDIFSELDITYGKLKSVTTTGEGIILGGDSFISFYGYDLSIVWIAETGQPVYALASDGEFIYGAAGETILVYDIKGNQVDEWGPFDENSIITSISASNNYVAFADAGNKLVFVLDKMGALVSLVGQPGDQFVIPSPYFDIFVSDNDLLVTANPGKRNVEFRNIKGDIQRTFGEAGSALEYFCGCCNPSHFSIMPGGNIVTAEKGINRIKIVDPDGALVELVSQPGNFVASVPVDLATGGDGLIFAANPADSRLYSFKRK